MTLNSFFALLLLGSNLAACKPRTFNNDSDAKDFSVQVTKTRMVTYWIEHESFFRGVWDNQKLVSKISVPIPADSELERSLQKVKDNKEALAKKESQIKNFEDFINKNPALFQEREEFELTRADLREQKKELAEEYAESKERASYVSKAFNELKTRARTQKVKASDVPLFIRNAIKKAVNGGHPSLKDHLDAKYTVFFRMPNDWRSTEYGRPLIASDDGGTTCKLVPSIDLSKIGWVSDSDYILLDASNPQISNFELTDNTLRVHFKIPGATPYTVKVNCENTKKKLSAYFELFSFIDI